MSRTRRNRTEYILFMIYVITLPYIALEHVVKLIYQ